MACTGGSLCCFEIIQDLCFEHIQSISLWGSKLYVRLILFRELVLIRSTWESGTINHVEGANQLVNLMQIKFWWLK
jgi:hypothetical protein